MASASSIIRTCAAAVVLVAGALPAVAQKKDNSGGKQHGATLSAIEQMQFPVITVGQALNGALTTSDLLRSDDTYADGFNYNGRAGEIITITMRSSDMDSWLVIDDPNSQFMEYNDDGAGGNDAQLVVTLPRDGRYIILANTVVPGVTGNYTLTLTSGGTPAATKAAPASDGLTLAQIAHLPLPAIHLGETINGQLTTSDILRNDNTYADGFFYDGRAGEQITITLRSSDFDSWLVLDDPNGPMFEHDDDSAGGNDSRLTVTLPHDGRYVILANVVQRGATGSYTLSLTRGK
ncbi:MAG TPA: PPC domain-containing protein [Gemmatimonadales bacterium]|nr:PPC domain-containing protein [Gemmatimonadales bacterium]